MKKLSFEIEDCVWEWLLTSPLNEFKTKEERLNLARLDFVKFIESNTIEEIEKQYKKHKLFLGQYSKNKKII